MIENGMNGTRFQGLKAEVCSTVIVLDEDFGGETYNMRSQGDDSR